MQNPKRLSLRLGFYEGKNKMESERVKKGEQLFRAGYNCSQAVVGAFADLLPVDFDTAMMLSSSFGGGMGRMREVCGAVSGMFMVAGFLKGYPTPETGEVKAAHYAFIRKMADEFKEKNGSIVCRQLLAGKAEIGGVPEERTESYYQKRPCSEYVKSCVAILEKYIGEN